jgi:spore coat polysaccharide biosynthesis predicted glycosyltransferase SpsG
MPSQLLALDATNVSADVLVVDSYVARADDTSRFEARVRIAIDDLARDLEVDVIIDPSPGADPTLHRAAKTTLAGARFALVDPATATMPVREIGEDVERIFVATGGADRTAVGAVIAQDVAAALPDVEVALAIGPWGSGSVPDGVRAVRTTGGLTAELAMSDVVVTAGGVTFLESLALGRPTIVVVVAENQLRAAEHACAVSAALPASVATAAGVAVATVRSAGRRRQLGAAARRLIDGRGATRVAEVICAQT